MTSAYDLTCPFNGMECRKDCALNDDHGDCLLAVSADRLKEISDQLEGLSEQVAEVQNEIFKARMDRH